MIGFREQFEGRCQLCGQLRPYYTNEAQWITQWLANETHSNWESMPSGHPCSVLTLSQPACVVVFMADVFYYLSTCDFHLSNGVFLLSLVCSQSFTFQFYLLTLMLLPLRTIYCLSVKAAQVWIVYSPVFDHPCVNYLLVSLLYH